MDLLAADGLCLDPRTYAMDSANAAKAVQTVIQPSGHRLCAVLTIDLKVGSGFRLTQP